MTEQEKMKQGYLWNDDDENIYEYSQMYSSEDVKLHKNIEIREEEETATPNLANFVNPFGFNPIPVIQEEPQLIRGVSYVA